MQIIAHNLATTFVSNLHTCHYLAVIPRCCHRLAPALAALAAILAAAALPPLLADATIEADLLVDIVMFPQTLTLLPLVALSAAVDVDC